MKSKVLKRIMMPLAVIFLGIAGAFLTMSMSSTASVSDVQGYKFVSQADPCHAEQMCSPIFSPYICTSGSQQLWGKASPSSPVCDVPLYRRFN